MTDLLKYNIFMCLYAKKKKERGEKELSQAYFGFMFGSKKDDQEEKRNLLHAAEREMFFMLPLFGVSKHLKKLSSNRVMNCQGCNEI